MASVLQMRTGMAFWRFDPVISREPGEGCVAVNRRMLTARPDEARSC